MAKYEGPEWAHCDHCPLPAGQEVEFPDGRKEALCFECWHPVRKRCKVLHWINRYGRIMYAKGATTGPFNIKHK
jgi:hypothetical protein